MAQPIDGDAVVALVAVAGAACQVVLAGMLWTAATQVRAGDALRLGSVASMLAAMGTLLRAWAPTGAYSGFAAVSLIGYLGHAAWTFATLRSVRRLPRPLAALVPWVWVGSGTALLGLMLPEWATTAYGFTFLVTAALYGGCSLLVWSAKDWRNSQPFAALGLATAVAVAVFSSWGLASIFEPRWLERNLRQWEMACLLLIGLFANLLGTGAYLMMVLSELLARVKAHAARDPLTGAYNRHGLRQEIFKRFGGRRQARAMEGLGVIAIDIDHFKRINDRYGHAAGDAVLREAAQRLRHQLRRGDILARVGGEEFIALLPGTGADETDVVAERMRADIAAHPITLPEVAGPIAVTISLGTVQAEAEVSELQTEFARADAALYAAKRNGRNRVVRYRPGLDMPEPKPPSMGAGPPPATGGPDRDAGARQR